MQSSNPILRSISTWFQRNFSDPAAISLFMTLLLGLIFLELFGKLLLPILISIVLAYLLYPLVSLLKRWRFPRLLAVMVVFIAFLGLVLYAIFGLLPLLIKQLSNLINEIPLVFNQSQLWVSELIHKYPKMLSQGQLQQVMSFMQGESMKLGQMILQHSLLMLPNLLEVILYLVLVPLLVFFFLKDSKTIMTWVSQYMPEERGLVADVWTKVNVKIGAYVKGRVAEIILVGFIASLAFSLLGLQYALLLGSLVGISVIIPYLGAVIVTIPVVIIALMEWGLSAHFTYLLIVYGLIITLDANVLVPLLFSEVMDLHPVVIILSVVVFGGFWGFWGVFFAIPLATLVDVVLRAWPRRKILED